MFEPVRRYLEPVSLSHELLPDAWLERSVQSDLGDELLCEGMWQSGSKGEFRRAMVEAVRGAQEIVCAASFLWAQSELTDALLDAAGRGVRVYVLAASDQFLQKYTTQEQDWERERLEEHRALLREFSGRLLVRTCEIFHAKCLLVDPQSDLDDSSRSCFQSFISTANFNPALVASVELGVSLERREGAALFDRFRRAFWGDRFSPGLQLYESRGRADRLETVTPRDLNVPVPEQGLFRYSAPGAFALRDEVLAMCRAAKERLWVACYGLDLEHAVVESIIEARNRDVDVVLMTRVRPAVSEVARSLEQAGVEVVGHHKLHAKAIVSDEQVLVMTANLQRHGMDEGFEVGAKLEGAQAQALIDLLVLWRERFPWRLRCGARLHEAYSRLRLLDGWREGEVCEQETISLAEPVTADNAFAAEPHSPPDAPTSFTNGQGDRWAKAVRYEYQVVPPRLPRDVQEVRIEEKRPVDLFEHRSFIYVIGDKDALEVQAFLNNFQPPPKKKLRVEEKPPRKATRIPPRSRPYPLPLYRRGDRYFVVVSSLEEQGEAELLAEDFQAQIVVR